MSAVWSTTVEVCVSRENCVVLHFQQLSPRRMTFTTAPQTILVNVDVDTAPKLLTYLQSALSPSPHLAECAKLISEAKTFEFLMSLLQLTDQILLCSTAALAPTTGTTTAAVTPKDELISSERMIEKCYDAFISILFTIHNTTEFNQIIQLMVQKLTENTQDKATLRLRILVNVYNLLIVVENKFLVLKG